MHLWLHLLVFASVIGDIGNWLTAPFRGAKDLAGAVWRAIKHLWGTVAGVFHHVGGAWVALWHAVHALDVALAFLADSARNTLHWVVHHLNPKSVAHAITKAIRWAGREIGKAKRALGARISGALRWAHRQLNSVSHRLAGAFRYLVKRANKALHWIGHQGARMYRLLSSAPRLAAWLVAALIVPLFRYIVAHLEPIGLMVGRWLLANIGKLAVELETAITKLF